MRQDSDGEHWYRARGGARSLLAGLVLSTVGCGAMMQKINPPPPEPAPVISPYAQGQAAEHERHVADTQKAREAKAADADAETAEKDRKNAAKAAELEQECSATRAERLSYLKETIKEFHDELKELKPHLDWIGKHCGYKDTRGVLVQRERTKDGVIVRAKPVGEENEPDCDAQKPAGVTQERVKRALWINTREESDPLGTNYATNRNQFGVVNARCASADKAAGLDLYVTMLDFEGQKAILAR